MAANTTTAGTSPAPGRPDLEIPPSDLCSGTAIRKAARRVSVLYDGAIAPAGLRFTQMVVLMHVARHAEPTLSELAASLVLDRSALSDNLKPMMRDGLVAVRPCEMDKRGRRVSLTGDGYAKLEEAIELWRIAQHRFDAAFGLEAAADLRQALGRISDDSFLAAFDAAL
jgi:DNA-binding MarR family transcriptional regulator